MGSGRAKMSRAKSQYERELLKSLRSARKHNPDATEKACVNPNCPSLGKLQPVENFYKNGQDHYCIMCRRARAEAYRFAHQGEPRKPRSRQKYYEKQLMKTRGKICKEHKVPEQDCGCALEHRLFKSKKWRAIMSNKMKGNKHAKGNKSHKGTTLSTMHKVRIGSAMRRRWAARRGGGQVDATPA